MSPTGTEIYEVICVAVAAAAALLCLRTASHDADEPSAIADGHKPNILVVDDDVIPTKMMKRTLEKAGFNVLTAGNGVKALDLIRYSASLNIVLLDCQMPKLDGSETIGHIRKYFTNVKVIGVTCLEPSRIPESYRQDVDLLLMKPVKASELLEAVVSLGGISNELPSSSPGGMGN